MKKISLTFLILLSLVSSTCWSETREGLEYKNNFWYLKTTDTPFTEEISSDVEKGYIEDGLKHGHWETYYDDGTVFIRGTYRRGKRDGYFEYFSDNGSVRRSMTGIYKNGVKVSD